MEKNTFRIKSIKAKEILDSGRRSTVEVELKTDFGKFFASSPSGISRGKYEAKTVASGKAVENIEKIIAPILVKEDLGDQKRIDEILIGLDIGANATLPVSLAFCRAGAKLRKLALYQYISQLLESPWPPRRFPKPSFNMLEGGKHAENNLLFQEFMVVSQKENFKENLAAGKKIYRNLKNILRKKFKKIGLSAEGAFSAPIDTVFEALDFVLEAAKGEDVKIAIDAAGAEFENYRALVEKYPIISLEDPFPEDDFERFAKLKNEIGERVLIFGDDLTVSNVEKMKTAKEKEAINGLILKPNQVGTVSGTLAAARLAKTFGWKIMVSNRARETKDDFIADLAFGIGADFIKSGAPFPKERMAKYNRLLAIEKELRK